MKIQKINLLDLFLDLIIAWGFIQFFNQWMLLNDNDDLFKSFLWVSLFFFALYWLWFIYILGDSLFLFIKRSPLSPLNSVNIHLNKGTNVNTTQYYSSLRWGFFIFFALFILYLENTIPNIFVGHIEDFIFLFGITRFILSIFFGVKFLKLSLSYKKIPSLKQNKTKTFFSSIVTCWIYIVFSFSVSILYILIGLNLFLLVLDAYTWFFIVFLLDVLIIWIIPFYHLFKYLNFKRTNISQSIIYGYYFLLNRLQVFTIILFAYLGIQIFRLFFISSFSFFNMTSSLILFIIFISFVILYNNFVGTFFHKNQSNISSYYKTLAFSYLHSILFLGITAFSLVFFKTIQNSYEFFTTLLISVVMIGCLLIMLILKSFYNIMKIEIYFGIFVLIGIVLSTLLYLYQIYPILSDPFTFILQLCFWIMILPILQVTKLINNHTHISNKDS